MSDLSCQWIPRGQRRFFSLSPFRVVKGDLDMPVPGSQIGHDGSLANGAILVASFGQEARIKRLRGSNEHLAKEAQALAEETGNPVVIGRQVGVDSEGLPTWETLGFVRTAKADPLSAEAFEGWATSMADLIRGNSRAELGILAAESLEFLEFDFRGIAPAQLERALAGYSATISSPSATLMNVQRVSIRNALAPVIRSVGGRVSQIPNVRAGLGTAFSLPDKQISDVLSRSHAFWARNRYGQISEGLSSKARGIISRGVEQGFGRDEIGRQLGAMTRDGLQMKGYWRTVAANHIARARSYSTGRTYQAAGIEYFRIEAVLDDRTTHICEFLHGKILPVGASVTRMNNAINSEDPLAVLSETPFLRDRGEYIDVAYPDGSTRRVADIVERSTGGGPARDPTGVYNPRMSQSDMVDAAIGLPGYHHGCRTTTVPV